MIFHPQCSSYTLLLFLLFSFYSVNMTKSLLETLLHNIYYSVWFFMYVNFYITCVLIILQLPAQTAAMNNIT